MIPRNTERLHAGSGGGGRSALGGSVPFKCARCGKKYNGKQAMADVPYCVPCRRGKR